MTVQAPNIPRPKHKDADYMKVWHKLLEKELDNIRISRECHTWRMSFYIVAFILFVITIQALVFL